jgi:dihydroneopterin aldolase
VSAGSATIAIRGLRVHGHHGVLASERDAGQDFLVDAELSVDIDRAAALDDLAHTVDYATLSQALADIVAGPPVDLMETLASRLLDVCLADPRVLAATVTVHKPAAPVPVPVADVAVTVTGTRR